MKNKLLKKPFFPLTPRIRTGEKHADLRIRIRSTVLTCETLIEEVGAEAVAV